jgi:lysophospholipase L1-like esterase
MPMFNQSALPGAGRKLVIVGIGDSHINGSVPVATVGSDVLGLFALQSPKDRLWNGSAYSDVFGANSSINVVTGSQDGNLGLSTNVGSFINDIPRLLRAAYPGAGDITVVNLGVGGASAFSWAGEQSHAYIQAVANATAGDTVTLAGTTYTFVASASAANEVTIAGTAQLTVANLRNAIHAEGTGFGAGTEVNANVYMPNAASATYTKVSSKATGTGANSLTLSTSTTARINTANSSLTSVNPATLALGSATSALYTNGKARLVGLPIGEADTSTVFVITLGSNDANRAGYRAATFQTELQKLVTDIATDFPSAKVVIWRTMSMSGTGNTFLSSTVLPAVDAVVSANSSFVSSVNMNALGSGTGNVKILSSDGLHATNYGYSLIAQLFARGIAAAVGW